VRPVYIPRRGDAVWLNFNPQSGHEQAGRRPALVLSLEEYNRKTGLGVFCPIPSQVKGYPFEIKLPAGLPVTGVVLADQVKSLDWQVREAALIKKLPTQIVNEAANLLLTLFGL
jgi:mRNA interferase MazF